MIGIAIGYEFSSTSQLAIVGVISTCVHRQPICYDYDGGVILSVVAFFLDFLIVHVDRLGDRYFLIVGAQYYASVDDVDYACASVGDVDYVYASVCGVDYVNATYADLIYFDLICDLLIAIETLIFLLSVGI